MQVVQITQDISLCCIMILVLFVHDSFENRRHDRWERIAGKLRTMMYCYLCKIFVRVEKGPILIFVLKIRRL